MYRRGEIPERDFCGEQVTIHVGMPVAPLWEAGEWFFTNIIAPGMFPEMRALIDDLQARGCQVWLVSGSNEWVIQPAARVFGVPPERVISARTSTRDGIVLNEGLIVPIGPGKRDELIAHGKSTLDAAFGNTIYDVELLKLAAHPVAINPDKSLEQLALERSWPIFRFA